MTLMMEMVMSKRDSALQEITRLQEHIAVLEKKAAVSDEIAEKMLRMTIDQLRKEKKKFSVFELHSETRLPYEQIGKVMEKLEKKGVVREADD